MGMGFDFTIHHLSLLISNHFKNNMCSYLIRVFIKIEVILVEIWIYTCENNLNNNLIIIGYKIFNYLILDLLIYRIEELNIYDIIWHLSIDYSINLVKFFFVANITI